MATIDVEYLFTIDLKPNRVEGIGVSPRGLRTIGHVAGSFEGPQLKGEVLSGADWFLLASEGAGEVDVRLTLKTADGDLIYMHYTGMLNFDEEARRAFLAGKRPAGKFPVRTAVRLETGSAPYQRLNSVQAIGIGYADIENGHVHYEIYAL